MRQKQNEPQWRVIHLLGNGKARIVRGKRGFEGKIINVPPRHSHKAYF
jgi:hypothetical protein